VPKNSRIVSKLVHGKLLISYQKLVDAGEMIAELTQSQSITMKNDIHLAAILRDIRDEANGLLDVVSGQAIVVQERETA
jgi:hypothetical protein